VSKERKDCQNGNPVMIDRSLIGLNWKHFLAMATHILPKPRQGLVACLQVRIYYGLTKKREIAQWLL